MTIASRASFGLIAGTALALSFGPSLANEPVSLVLNWNPGGDHSPIFYALQEGWYADAGIDLEVASGSGSGMSSQQVGSGASDIGIAELGTAFVTRSQGGDLKAVMTIYANAPFVL